MRSVLASGPALDPHMPGLVGEASPVSGLTVSEGMRPIAARVLRGGLLWTVFHPMSCGKSCWMYVSRLFCMCVMLSWWTVNGNNLPSTFFAIHYRNVNLFMTTNSQYSSQAIPGLIGRFLRWGKRGQQLLLQRVTVRMQLYDRLQGSLSDTRVTIGVDGSQEPWGDVDMWHASARLLTMIDEDGLISSRSLYRLHMSSSPTSQGGGDKLVSGKRPCKLHSERKLLPKQFPDNYLVGFWNWITLS